MLKLGSRRAVISNMGIVKAAVRSNGGQAVKAWCLADGEGGARPALYVYYCSGTPQGYAYAVAPLEVFWNYNLKGTCIPDNATVHLSRLDSDAEITPAALENGEFSELTASNAAWSCRGVEGFQGILAAWVRVDAADLSRLVSSMAVRMAANHGDKVYLLSGHAIVISEDAIFRADDALRGIYTGIISFTEDAEGRAAVSLPSAARAIIEFSQYAAALTAGSVRLGGRETIITDGDGFGRMAAALPVSGEDTTFIRGWTDGRLAGTVHAHGRQTILIGSSAYPLGMFTVPAAATAHILLLHRASGVQVETVPTYGRQTIYLHSAKLEAVTADTEPTSGSGSIIIPPCHTLRTADVLRPKVNWRMVFGTEALWNIAAPIRARGDGLIILGENAVMRPTSSTQLGGRGSVHIEEASRLRRDNSNQAGGAGTVEVAYADNVRLEESQQTRGAGSVKVSGVAWVSHQLDYMHGWCSCTIYVCARNAGRCSASVTAQHRVVIRFNANALLRGSDSLRPWGVGTVIEGTDARSVVSDILDPSAAGIVLLPDAGELRQSDSMQTAASGTVSDSGAASESTLSDSLRLLCGNILDAGTDARCVVDDLLEVSADGAVVIDTSDATRQSDSLQLQGADAAALSSTATAEVEDAEPWVEIIDTVLYIYRAYSAALVGAEITIE